MYFLITMHNPPSFFTTHCQQVSPVLNYVHSLTKTCIENGKVHTFELSSNSHLSSDGDWMVECPRSALEQLRKQDIHPFKTKKEAKDFAVLKQLRSYRYLKV
ncbi:hypothetical protein FM037_13560 [Shewanella psychropiezotolerans]|uniref:Uncharacterized protein n=1 Tax=Shewanella psychropiezotolerans TaxID=2593655 RepID=A0ABX5WY89_9GAMM|nr:hypothetical protein [Shewanella psychropiezotolerans]QDO84071.1 hypothetical protein FM037_13560 [Shewanella psychropiezotolerans]